MFLIIICTSAVFILAKTKNINGVRLVLEEEGHDIEDNEILKFYHKESLMLLNDNEKWVSKNKQVRKMTLIF